MEKLIRVLLTKPTQDCHDRGVRYQARQLRDAGFEVVNTAVQEDVDVVGVSTSSGGHMAVFEDLLQGLRHAGAKNILVIGGDIIPNKDPTVCTSEPRTASAIAFNLNFSIFPLPIYLFPN